tara:strand:+ start:4048 stop:7173 length:3126 start_codon:yes stop_codon:yes gene_type:complete
MSFSLVGTTITQTATDSNLSGLSALSGVVTTILTGIANKTRYNAGGLRLNVQGNLSFDSEIEELVIAGNDATNPVIDVQSGGVFNVGSILNRFGVDRQSSGTAIIFDRTLNNIENMIGRPVLRVRSGGTLNFNGGEMFVHGAVQFDSGSIIRIAGVGCKINALNIAVSNINPLLIQQATDAQIQGLTLNNMTTSIAADATLFKNLISAHTGSVLNPNISLPDNIFVTQRDNTFGLGSEVDVAHFGSKWLRLINVNVGTDFIADAPNISSADNIGLCEVYQEIIFRTVDASGLIRQGVLISAMDVDNGSRLAANQINNNPDYIPNRTYTGTSDVNGEIPFLNTSGILTGVAYRVVGGSQFDGNAFFDVRTNSGNVLTFFFYDYGLDFTVLNTTLKSVTTINQDIIILDDDVITESNPSLVAAYPITVNITGNNITITGDSSTLQTLTAEQFYDSVALYMRDNYGMSDIRVDRIGNTLDLGSRNLTLDFITYDSGDLIETTGTVTLTNGSTANFFDSTQDSSLSEINGSLIRVYGSESDRDARTNAIFEGARYNFLFASVPANPVYLWVTQGNTELPSEKTLVQGINTVDLSTAGVLTAQGDTLTSIDNQLGFIQKIIYVDTRLGTNGDGSNDMPFNNLPDAVTKFNSESFSFIELKTDSIAPAVASVSLSGVKIKGGNPTAYLVMDNVSLENGELEDLLLSGQQLTGDTISVYSNVTFAADYIGATGNIINAQVLSILGLPISISFQGPATVNCATVMSVGDVTFNMSGQSVAFRKITGKFIFAGITDGTCSLDSFSGQLTLDSTCTGGSLRVNDTLDIIDNSDGTTTTITDLPTAEESYTYFTSSNREDAFKADAPTIADAVWDEPYTEHTTAGTFGKLMDIIRKSNLSLDGQVDDTNATANQFNTNLTDPSGIHNHQVLLFVSGQNEGYSALIASYTNGADGTITLQNNLPSVPANGDEFVILPYYSNTVEEIAAEVDSTLTTSHGSGTWQTADVSGIELIRKITTNKVTRSGDIITVFEDDGVTVHARYDLSNGERIPL